MCIPLANIFCCCIQSFGSACIYKAPKQIQRHLEALCTIREKATDPCRSSSKRFTSCSPSGPRQIIPVRWSCGCSKREKCGTTRVFHLENEQRCDLEGKCELVQSVWLDCAVSDTGNLCQQGFITPSFHCSSTIVCSGGGTANHKVSSPFFKSYTRTGLNVTLIHYIST